MELAVHGSRQTVQSPTRVGANRYATGTGPSRASLAPGSRYRCRRGSRYRSRCRCPLGAATDPREPVPAPGAPAPVFPVPPPCHCPSPSRRASGAAWRAGVPVRGSVAVFAPPGLVRPSPTTVPVRSRSALARFVAALRFPPPLDAASVAESPGGPDGPAACPLAGGQLGSHRAYLSRRRRAAQVPHNHVRRGTACPQSRHANSSRSRCRSTSGSIVVIDQPCRRTARSPGEFVRVACRRCRSPLPPFPCESVPSLPVGLRCPVRCRYRHQAPQPFRERDPTEPAPPALQPVRLRQEPGTGRAP